MKNRIRKTIGIVITVLSIGTAAALIAAAVNLYLTGSRAAKESGDPALAIYTAEAIRAAFRPIAPVVYAFLLSLAAGIVYRAFTEEKNGISAPRPVKKGKPANKKAVAVLRIAVAAAAVILIILGIAGGGLRDVLVKAVKICMECVGLG